IEARDTDRIRRPCNNIQLVELQIRNDHGNRTTLHFSSRDRLVYAVWAGSIKHCWVPWVHRQSRYRQLIEPGVHCEPVIASIQALEHTASALASHVERLAVRGIYNDRGTPTHCEIGEAGVDALPGVSSIETAEYALSPGRCVNCRWHV